MKRFRLAAYFSLLLAIAACTAAPAPVPAAEQAPSHPLDPLTASEVERAAGILKAAQEFPQNGRFATIALKEPPKDEVLSFKPGTAFGRQAFAIVLDPKGNRTFEALLDLKAGQLVTWTEVKDVQPAVLTDEYDAAGKIVKANPAWQEAMRKRGIDDFDKVQIDGWAVGQLESDAKGARLLRALSYFKGDATNIYGRPIEGVVALVNMNTEKVIEVIDSGVLPLPPASQELDRKSTGTREAPKPLSIVQPEGVSFRINGHEVSWQKWRFRYSMHPREGLVLHTVGYEDEGRFRSILYRGSLSEMVVPYGDADRNWRWRAAFDVGEYNVGRLASSIEPGTDAPGNATLIDATFADDSGTAVPLKRAVGIYERDGGLLWKHYDVFSEKNESRRARELVIFFIATIGNYDYAVHWIFHQDGTLEVDAALSGIMLPKGVRETSAADHSTAFDSGHLVAANVVAPHHQHFFNFRLDFDVDGRNNSVTEMNTKAMPAGAGNPALNGMLMQETVLATERDAQRSMDAATARTWAVANPSVHNPLGHRTSYILVPSTNAVPYLAPSSQVRRRAGFINNAFWATRFNPDELNAAGPYPNQSRGGDGLPRWTATPEPLDGQDVVVWYTVGLTHIPRPEEWPVMPATHIGFKMIPGGFFSKNPALDVP